MQFFQRLQPRLFGDFLSHTSNPNCGYTDKGPPLSQTHALQTIGILEVTNGQSTPVGIYCEREEAAKDAFGPCTLTQRTVTWRSTQDSHGRSGEI